MALDDGEIMYTDYEIFKDLIKEKKLEIILNSFHVESEGYYLYFPNKSQFSPKLRAFIDHFKELISKH